MYLNVHHIEPVSGANGPGKRFVVWLQGCNLGCPGCINPETHDFNHGEKVLVENIFRLIEQNKSLIEGITISGGEPLLQLEALSCLLLCIKINTGLSTIIFTGFDWKEVLIMDHTNPFLENVDVLLTGRFDNMQYLSALKEKKSHKKIHLLSNWYSEKDILSSPEAEVFITSDGDICLSGVIPLVW